MLYKQEVLINQLKEQLPPKISLADVLAETLNVSIDSAYRRVNGKTVLTFDEACLLAKKYRISMDTISGTKKGMVAFYRRELIKNVDDVETNLKFMLDFFKLQKRCKERKLIYSTKDIPIFYHFSFPELGAFNMFAWLNAISTESGLKDTFEPQYYIERFSDIWAGLVNEYSEVESHELWSEFAIRGFINQLDYYYQSGLMGSKKMALTVCEQLQSVLQVIEKQAISGYKIHPSHPETKSVYNYHLYFNELMVMENAVLAYLDDKKLFLQTYAYFNFHPTTDLQQCNQMEFWMNNQIRKSVKLSDSREKERNQYFMRNHKELKTLMDKITNY